MSVKKYKSKRGEGYEVLTANDGRYVREQGMLFLNGDVRMEDSTTTSRLTVPVVAATRTARGQLLPNVSSSAGASWREGRTQLFNGVGFGANANTIGSSANINASLNYGLDVLLQPRAAKASERATDAEREWWMSEQWKGVGGKVLDGVHRIEVMAGRPGVISGEK